MSDSGPSNRLSRFVRRIASMPSKAWRWYENSERRIGFGRGPTYYLIRVSYPNSGILAIVKTTFQHIRHAIDSGCVPVVDLKNHPCQYHRPGELGAVNVWERFFEQPCGIGPEDVPRHGNKILGSVKFAPTRADFIDVNTVLPSHRPQLIDLARQFNRHIRPNADIRKHFEERRRKILGDGSRKVLGVLCRGTDYTQRHPSGHPVQPAADDVIRKIKDESSQLRFDKIFLATEDPRIRAAFVREFGDMVLADNQRPVTLGDKRYIAELDKTEYDYYEGPVEYMTAIHILSRCDYFIGGLTAGTLTAFLWSPNVGFEYEYAFDLGKYP